MNSNRQKKSYAAIFLSDGLLIILDNQQKIVEHVIPETGPNCTSDEIGEIIYEAISKFDKTVAGVCICINNYSEWYKNALNEVTKLYDIQNCEIVEECIIESFEVISQLNIKLLNRKIIWTCLKQYCCIWNGLTCTIKRYNFNDKSLEGLLLTTKCPPDVIICETSYEKDFDKNFLNELFPDCKILFGSHNENNKKNAALKYIQMVNENKLECTPPPVPRRNTYHYVFPQTIIHVGMSFYIDTVSATYFLNGKEREFTFAIETSLKSGPIEEMLKIAARRVNGKFGCICIVDDCNDLPDIVFDQKWALQFGFKKAEIIDKRTADYVETVSQLSVKIKSSDIVWISSSYDNYEVWQDNIFQIDVKISQMKNKPPAEKYIPNYIIFKDQSWKIYREVALKKQYPQCELLFCNCQHNYKTTLKYAQAMAANNLNNPAVINFDKEPPIPPKRPVQQSPEEFLKMNNQTWKTQVETSKIENTAFAKLISTDTLQKPKNTISEKTVSSKQIQKETIYEFPKQITINNDQIKATGIDLGTSRCCAAVNRKNAMATVPLGNTGQRLLPSYVAYNEENPVCGNVVLDRMRHYYKSTIFDSKRIIGRNINEIEIDSSWSFKVSSENNKVLIEVKKGNDSLKKTADKVAADLLKHVKQKSEEFQGTKLYEAVITVPAAFTNDQKEATIRAAELAGWQNVTLLPEPVAASFAYFNERPIPNNSNVLVFDLGGGTLDVCIFEIENNGINIISNTGDTKLGGRNFDNVLFNHFKNQLDTKHGITLIKDKKFKLILNCQRIKETLSTTDSCTLDVDEYSPEMHEFISITREEFQNITKPLLNRIRNTLLSALHDSKYKEDQIKKVLFVGGGSRMPMVKNLLLELFPNAEHCCDDNPDEVVATGAAYYAYSQQLRQNPSMPYDDDPPSQSSQTQVSPRYEEPPSRTSAVSQQKVQSPTSAQGICARALFDYEQQEDDEIGFNVNDKITNIEQIDEGWWKGKLNGRWGLFPANFVQLI